MRITKLGHCALVLEIDGIKILTDPGNFTAEAQAAVTGLHGVLITHEHQDHLHVESLKRVLAHNPTAVVVGNSAVAKIIGESIADTQVVVAGDGQKTDISGVSVEGFGRDHALVYPPAMGLVENTGYLVANTFYFPGDNFYNPNKKIDILALPTAGPWMKMSEAVDFAKAIKPRVAFGVHDAMVMPFFRGWIGALLATVVPETKFIEIKDGETKEF